MAEPIDPAALVRLRDAGAATVYEGSGRRGALDGRIAPATLDAAIAGAALTVACVAGDNLAVHVAVERARPGDILVIDGCDVAVGYFGDVLAVAAQARGIVGAVVDGGVRDVKDIARLGFPLWGSRRAIRGAAKHDPGHVGGAVVCGGAIVRTGDLVVADADGVVVVERDRLEATLTAADERLAAERVICQRLRDGELTLDLLGLRSQLAR